MKFHLECKLHFPSAQLMLRKMHLTNVSESTEAEYWVSCLRFYVKKREYELWKIVLESLFCTVTADSKSRWPHGKKKRRISAMSASNRLDSKWYRIHIGINDSSAYHTPRPLAWHASGQLGRQRALPVMCVTGPKKKSWIIRGAIWEYRNLSGTCFVAGCQHAALTNWSAPCERGWLRCILAPLTFRSNQSRKPLRTVSFN